MTSPARATDLKQALRTGIEALSAPEPTRGRGSTSDLSVDEVLLLHASGWEPVDLVAGVAVMAVPPYIWNWGQGEIAAASESHAAAFSAAAARLRSACNHVDGAGVVGVTVELDVHPHHIDVTLSGTAIRRPPGTGPSGGGQPFISDLSARDLTFLGAAGWAPLGIAFGASFVYAPRRSAGTALQQSGQNVELANFTQAMYASREAAMDRMQRSALALGAQGVVAVQITEGPMAFARHAVGFSTWGTAVWLTESEHRRLEPQVVMTLDDAVVEFEASSLRRP